MLDSNVHLVRGACSQSYGLLGCRGTSSAMVNVHQFSKYRHRQPYNCETWRSSHIRLVISLSPFNVWSTAHSLEAVSLVSETQNAWPFNHRTMFPYVHNRNPSQKITYATTSKLTRWWSIVPTLTSYGRRNGLPSPERKTVLPHLSFHDLQERYHSKHQHAIYHTKHKHENSFHNSFHLQFRQ
mgnify:CR=1 FL=1